MCIKNQADDKVVLTSRISKINRGKYIGREKAEDGVLSTNSLNVRDSGRNGIKNIYLTQSSEGQCPKQNPFCSGEFQRQKSYFGLRQSRTFSGLT